MLRNKEFDVDEFWWKSQQCAKSNNYKTIPDNSNTYIALSDSYLDLSSSPFDSESPVPVSKIMIKSRQQNLLINNPDKVTDYKPANSAEDILQEWRVKRKQEISNHKSSTDSPTQDIITTSTASHISEYNTVRNKKQEYYEQLTNKYLHRDKHTISNPNTPKTPNNICIETSASASPHIASIDVNTDTNCKTQTRDKHAEFSQANYNSKIAVEQLEQDPTITEHISVVKVDAETNTDNNNIRKSNKIIQTKHIIHQSSPTVKYMTTQSVQTFNSNEVAIQTVILPSPPTKEMNTISVENPQELEDSLWSVSSMTSESIAEKEIQQVVVHEEPDLLDIYKEDDLIKLLVEKAQFYEQHIENINNILNH
ncbi:hypothetical protein LOD99_4338 [Oopsacas minuta]|uniref:Uncharacterized protein n=1 Tax=Oopsacas minuta TaxID=111878 RepID=A0AAV7JV02_9METZ|nr:hypothetical protein LOD99_4338 [Oopsacas minuta]